jgi:CelD/BcsL family acetyltransferase involved in cellulose biosynthesis
MHKKKNGGAVQAQYLRTCRTPSFDFSIHRDFGAFNAADCKKMLLRNFRILSECEKNGAFTFLRLTFEAVGCIFGHIERHRRLGGRSLCGAGVFFYFF